MKKELAERFLDNQISNHDGVSVMEWFETEEGQDFLKNRLDSDKCLMSNKELAELVYEVESEKIYKSIQEKITTRQVVRKKRWDVVSYMMKIAAVIAVIATSSLLVIKHEADLQQHHAELVGKSNYYQTDHDQHMEITLSDGSMIRLNSNSELIVPGNFMRNNREVTLIGEAYFDVNHNPDRKFIIHVNQSDIEVLGTAFNVRSYSGEKNVQVAVMNGTVSFRNLSLEDDHVLLNEGDYAYLDIDKKLISVDNIAVGNYLAWKNGRLVFEDMSLNLVCNQLGRLYDITCHYKNENIREYHVTARFSDESLEKALDVIALTLKIGYEMDGDKIIWIDSENS